MNDLGDTPIIEFSEPLARRRNSALHRQSHERLTRL